MTKCSIFDEIFEKNMHYLSIVTLHDYSSLDPAGGSNNVYLGWILTSFAPYRKWDTICHGICYTVAYQYTIYCTIVLPRWCDIPMVIPLNLPRFYHVVLGMVIVHGYTMVEPYIITIPKTTWCNGSIPWYYHDIVYHGIKIPCFQQGISCTVVLPWYVV